MATELQINSIKRAIGQLTFRVAIMQLREAQSDFVSTEKGQVLIQIASNTLGVPVTFLDNFYYHTSFDNWKKIIEVLNPIAQQFEWEKERFDCDNRANLMSSLSALMFRVNTCGTMYCRVTNIHTGVDVGYHYNNIIVDDAGNTYLWDVDNGGQYAKITSKNPVIGNWKYELISMRQF